MKSWAPIANMKYGSNPGLINAFCISALKSRLFYIRADDEKTG